MPKAQSAVLAQEARDIVLVVGQDGRILEANQAAATAYEYSPAELLALTIDDLRAPESRLQTAQQMAEAEAAGTAGILFETVHRRKDGSTFPVEVSCRGIPWGKQRALLGIVRDISERVEAQRALRLSEARFGAAFRASPDGIALSTLADGRLLEVNDSALRLFGYSREEVIGRTVADLGIWSLPEDRTRLVRPLLAQGAVRDLEVELRPKAGAPLVILLSAEILDIGGERCLLSVLHDITERKRTEEVLREREAALRAAHEELEQRVRDRTAELAQSVKTLTAETARRALAEEALWQRSLQLRALTAELTLAEDRERRRLAAVLHDDLQQLLVGARLRLGDLDRVSKAELRQTAETVEDLLGQALEVSRSLTRELSPPILQEGGLVLALEWLSHWMQDRHGLEVKLAAASDLPSLSDDAKVLLFQAVRELLFNVVKHAQVSQAAVEISRRGEQTRIVVWDEGRGFDPGGLLVEGGRTGGFGLFSIRERLGLLGGRLQIESAEGKGTQVTLLVPPGSPSPAPSVGSLSPGPPAPEAYPRDGKRIRILVVDDHGIVRQGLVQLLNAEPDFEVVGEASDGMEACLLAAKLRPRLVIMDVGLREMDGIEATRVIHAECPEVQVIGLSMYPEAEKGSAMREAGAVDYLSKLGPSERLLAAIRACARPEV